MNSTFNILRDAKSIVQSAIQKGLAKVVEHPPYKNELPLKCMRKNRARNLAMGLTQDGKVRTRPWKRSGVPRDEYLKAWRQKNIDAGLTVNGHPRVRPFKNRNKTTLTASGINP